jgi:hypothetical protein
VLRVLSCKPAPVSCKLLHSYLCPTELCCVWFPATLRLFPASCCTHVYAHLSCAVCTFLQFCPCFLQAAAAAGGCPAGAGGAPHAAKHGAATGARQWMECSRAKRNAGEGAAGQDRRIHADNWLLQVLYTGWARAGPCHAASSIGPILMGIHFTLDAFYPVSCGGSYLVHAGAPSDA